MTKVLTLPLPIFFKITSKVSGRALFYVCAALLAIIFVIYVYLINATVMNVVAREDSEKEIAALSTSLGEMEFKYISLKNGVTLDLAYQKGFGTTAATEFLARENSAPSVLSYNTR